MKTKEVEHLLYRHLWKKGWYGVFEVGVPRDIQNKYHRERVDMLSYETKGIWRAYEIKVSRSDLYSKNALSWIGHYNYLVVTEDLLEDAQKIVPKDIGIYVACEKRNKKWIELARNPKKRNLLCCHESMMFAFMQALSREYKKYRKVLEKADKQGNGRK